MLSSLLLDGKSYENNNCVAPIPYAQYNLLHFNPILVSNKTLHPQPYFARRCLNIINLLHSKFEKNFPGHLYTQTLAAATWNLHKLSCQLNGRLSDKKENLESISLKNKGPIIKLNMSSNFHLKMGYRCQYILKAVLLLIA